MRHRYEAIIATITSLLGVLASGESSGSLAPLSSAEPVSATEAVVERACTKMQRTDSYDITSESASYQTIGTASEELYDRWSAKAGFDGSDYHIERSELTGERRQSATIRIGESGYEKSTSNGGVWKEMSRKPGDLNGFLIGLGSDPICPTTADFRSGYHYGSTAKRAKALHERAGLRRQSLLRRGSTSEGRCNAVHVGHSG